MTITTVVGEAVAVVLGDISAPAEEAFNPPNVALVVGYFKRGRMDKAVKIDEFNLRSELGYTPKNPYYQCVQAAIEEFGSVWVYRLGEFKQSVTEILLKQESTLNSLVLLEDGSSILV